MPVLYINKCVYVGLGSMMKCVPKVIPYYLLYKNVFKIVPFLVIFVSFIVKIGRISG